jgi:hypothetical protein
LNVREGDDIKPKYRFRFTKRSERDKKTAVNEVGGRLESVVVRTKSIPCRLPHFILLVEIFGDIIKI